MPVIELRRQSRVLRSSTWLLDHARNLHSQFGEDGILETIFGRIGTGKRWCVDAGALDGEQWSNTHHLVSQGWEGVLIEGDSARFEKLKATYKDNWRARCRHRMIGPGDQSLDAILGETGAPYDFDLLSIDIDGAEWHVWNALQNYRPRVVVAAFNPSVPNDVYFVQDFEAHVHQGCSLLALQELGRAKGYELAAATTVNAIFVLKDEFPALDIADNSIDAMYASPYTARIFQGYDGMLYTAGLSLLWKGGQPVEPDQLQVLLEEERVYRD